MFLGREGAVFESAIQTPLITADAGQSLRWVTYSFIHKDISFKKDKPVIAYRLISEVKQFYNKRWMINIMFNFMIKQVESKVMNVKTNNYWRFIS